MTEMERDKGEKNVEIFSWGKRSKKINSSEIYRPIGANKVVAKGLRIKFVNKNEK